jgi:hypothetical protein
MKKIMIALAFCSISNITYSQSAEAQQLLLDVEKLVQLKSILKQVYDGYEILHKGYTSIRDISEGNFNIHKVFLDGLMQVSPAVRNYGRVGEIISYQVKIVSEYRSAFNQFRQSMQFTVAELDQLSKVYARLLTSSVETLDELAMVITGGKMRMSDDERLQAIDRCYNKIVDQYSFLQEFNNQNAVLSVQREKEQQEIKLLKEIHGLP